MCCISDGKDVIRNFSLTLEPGEHLAVVGLNGAGKTTLVKMICGLTEATEGSVLYGGTDVREFNRDEYYRLFGAVFQDCSILPVTIEEIYIDEEYRGRGMATQFFEYLKSKEGIARLRIEVESDNEGAKRLYERMGFELLPYLQMVIDGWKSK